MVPGSVGVGDPGSGVEVDGEVAEAVAGHFGADRVAYGGEGDGPVEVDAGGAESSVDAGEGAAGGVGVEDDVGVLHVGEFERTQDVVDGLR